MSGTEITNRERESYRLRERVTIVDNILLSIEPLLASRLNEAALTLLSELDDERYRSAECVAARTDQDPENVSTILEQLYQRGFLEWQPASDPTYTPPVSVVVTVRDDREHLERCLDALVTLDYPTYEIVVVDDGSTDGTTTMVRDHPLAERGMLRLVCVGSESEPLGIGASRNRGVETARHDVIAFTDADCRPSATWLRELVPFLANADMVGGRIRPAGTTTRSRYEGSTSSLDMGDRPARVQRTGDTPYLATANLVGHRDVFDAVPFPDRDVAEDVDVCWRAIEAGFEVVYTPTGLVEHDYAGGLFDMMERRMVYGASEALLARSYGRTGQGRVSLPVDAILLVLSAPLAFLATGRLAIAATIVLTVGTIGIGLRIAASIRRYRMVREVVTPSIVFRSWGRTLLSTGYAIGREVTRYYLLPLGLGVITASVIWPGPAPFGLWLLFVAIFGFPIAVEYGLQTPDSSPLAYVTYYTVDHLSYQYGVYLGGIRYHTMAHLDPRSRFRLTAPAGLTAPVDERDRKSGITARK